MSFRPFLSAALLAGPGLACAVAVAHARLASGESLLVAFAMAAVTHALVTFTLTWSALFLGTAYYERADARARRRP